jgi:hypothetical protein
VLAACTRAAWPTAKPPTVITKARARRRQRVIHFECLPHRHRPRRRSMRFRPCRDVSAKLNSPRLGPPHRGLFVVRPGIQEVAHIVTEAFNLFATAVAKVTRALWGPSSSLRSVSVPAALWAHVCKSQVILDIYLFDFRKGSSSTIWGPGRALPVNPNDRKCRMRSGASASGQPDSCNAASRCSAISSVRRLFRWRACGRPQSRSGGPAPVISSLARCRMPSAVVARNSENPGVIGDAP